MDRCGVTLSPHEQSELRPGLSVEQGELDPWAADMQSRILGENIGEKVGKNTGANSSF